MAIVARKCDKLKTGAKETLIYTVIARRALAFSRERSAAGRGNPECLSNQKRWIAALRSQ
jgi:hypothetical protein